MVCVQFDSKVLTDWPGSEIKVIQTAPRYQDEKIQEPYCGEVLQ